MLLVQLLQEEQVEEVELLQQEKTEHLILLVLVEQEQIQLQYLDQDFLIQEFMQVEEEVEFIVEQLEREELEVEHQEKLFHLVQQVMQQQILVEVVEVQVDKVLDKIFQEEPAVQVS